MLKLTYSSLSKTALNSYKTYLNLQFSKFNFEFVLISLPKKRKRTTLLKSPHVNKKAREQFQVCAYKRLLDIYSSSSKTVDALMKLELPSGVEVEIKV